MKSSPPALTKLSRPARSISSRVSRQSVAKAGEITAIRDYCETDALNTWLLYLRFELLRGRYDAARFIAECDLVARTLEHAGRPHLDEFLAAWDRDRFCAVATGA